MSGSVGYGSLADAKIGVRERKDLRLTPRVGAWVTGGLVEQVGMERE